MNVEAAAAYAGRHKLHALLIAKGGEAVFERYGEGYTRDAPHALYSGTKSFWGVLAVAALEDGLLELDEPVARTCEEWNTQARKQRVTLRELLSLTSGIGFGGLGNAVPTYAAALAADIKDDPGAVFTYGGIPLQIFGAVLARKLAARGLTPHAYLQARILDPIGAAVGKWRVLKDGTSPLPTGAFLGAAQWALYGRFVAQRGSWNGREIVSARGLTQCFEPTTANARYGLGWWLRPIDEPADLVYASGARGQAMYIVPSLDLVIVHFGDSASFAHATFLRRLFA